MLLFNAIIFCVTMIFFYALFFCFRSFCDLKKSFNVSDASDRWFNCLFVMLEDI